MKKDYLFTSESVSEGHPDKVCDRISDMVVATYLGLEPEARVACETLTTTKKVFLAGETVSGYLNGKKVTSFRLADPNHKSGSYDTPTTSYTENPYSSSLDYFNLHNSIRVNIFVMTKEVTTIINAN